MPEAPKYRVVRKLEAGGMAEVFQAEMETIEGFKKGVAIKRVLPHLSQNRQFIEMFLDEARLSLKFNHANVAQTFSIGISDNTYFIVMEFIEGVNIRKMMEFHERIGQPVAPEQALFITNEVCKGLSYAHNLKGTDGKPLGVVHRDVSPPNVLLSVQGEVKIVDFGLAKATSQLESTDPGLIKGKFAYLSPEAAHGIEVDKRADIFAAATILWELLAGKRLFKGDSDYDTVMNVRSMPIPPVSSLNRRIPKEVDVILARALERDLGKRYQDAAEFGSDIMRLLFSKQMVVTSYDLGRVVQTIIDKEPKHVSREVDIIDRLIEDELMRITNLEGGEDPFSDGANPILASEMSGMLEASPKAMEDPRQWGLDLGAELGDMKLPDAKEPSSTGWRESKVFDLGMPAGPPAAPRASAVAPAVPRGASRLPPGVPGGQAAPALQLDPRPSPEKAPAERGGGPRYGLWLGIFLALAAAGGAVAAYFLLLNK